MIRLIALLLTLMSCHLVLGQTLYLSKDDSVKVENEGSSFERGFTLSLETGRSYSRIGDLENLDWYYMGVVPGWLFGVNAEYDFNRRFGISMGVYSALRGGVTQLENDPSSLRREFHEIRSRNIAISMGTKICPIRKDKYEFAIIPEIGVAKYVSAEITSYANNYVPQNPFNEAVARPNGLDREWFYSIALSWRLFDFVSLTYEIGESRSLDIVEYEVSNYYWNQVNLGIKIFDTKEN